MGEGFDMEDNNLINVWQEGNQEILKGRRFERSELETFLKGKVNKAALSLNLNILVYLAVQIAAMVLMGFDLYGYRSNPVMLKVFMPMLIVCSCYLGYGVFLLSYIWQINHGDLDLVTAINRKLKVYRTHYEAWMWIGAVSLLFLIFALNALVDNDQGTYRINRPVFFAAISALILLFIYAVQKAAQLIALREIRVYMEDLQNDVLEKSHVLEKSRRRHKIMGLILVIACTILFVLGIIRALGT